jgi:hypothetical protein
MTACWAGRTTSLSTASSPRFEEIIASSLGRHGPVITAYQKGQTLPPSAGALRVALDTETWDKEIAAYIGSDRMVGVTVGRTRSLLVEIELIRAAGALDRTIFLLPPTSRAEQRKRLAVLGNELGVPWHLLDFPNGRDVLALVMPAAGRPPVPIVSIAPDDLGYQAAIEVATTLLLGGAAETAPNPEARLAAAAARYLADPAAPPRAPAGAAARPALEVFPEGKAPLYRPLYRRKSAVPWLLSLGIPVLLTFVSGNNFERTKTVPVGTTTPVALVQDARSDVVWAALSGGYLGTVDTGNRKFLQRARLEVPVSELAVAGDDAAFLSAATGTVGVLNLRSGRTRWRSNQPAGVRGLQMDGDSIVFAAPARGVVTRLSLADGRLVMRRAVGGIPWSTLSSADGLDVANG